jgi:hypothetical protein
MGPEGLSESGATTGRQKERTIAFSQPRFAQWLTRVVRPKAFAIAFAAGYAVGMPKVFEQDGYSSFSTATTTGLYTFTFGMEAEAVFEVEEAV